MSGTKPKEATGQVNPQMAWLLLISIFIAAANTVLYKAALNSFSSPTTNYGFFANQFSILVYVFQALAFSIFILVRDPNTVKELFRIPQSVYVKMGFLDSASGTLGAIAGANCPAALQTVLNQLIIPITMVGAYALLKSRFESFQIWGSAFILLGAIVASSNYLFQSHSADSPHDAAATAMVSAAVILYIVSVVPSALSNIYKDGKMKEQDMNEVHTSTIVAFWQLWCSFLFLPLMSLPALGGLSYKEMGMQLSDGWTCFRGTNPNDPEGDCSNAAYLLMSYIMVNFVYNILMLAITKRGSAVLLVISQALSLPVTNIAFTLKIFMGDSAEPLALVDLLGLVLVCIGFLTYSGFGLAANFMVAQGPPGQMAYVHFEDVSEVIVSTELATRPDQLVSFLVSSILQQQTTQQAHRVRTHSMDAAAPPMLQLTEQNGLLEKDKQNEKAVERAESGALRIGGGGYSSLESAEVDDADVTGLAETEEPPTRLTASRAALEVARQAVRMLEDEVRELSTGLRHPSENSSFADAGLCFRPVNNVIKNEFTTFSDISLLVLEFLRWTIGRMNLFIDTTGSHDEYFNNYVRGLIASKLDGEVLSIAGTTNAFLFDHTGPMQKRGSEMYVRTAYTELMPKISASERPAIVTGTPGTGVKTMINYAAYMLLSKPLLTVGDRRQILIQTGDREGHYKIVMERMSDTIEPSGATAMHVHVRLFTSETFPIYIFRNEPGEVYRLISVRLGQFRRIHFDTERVIIFTQPDRDLERHFVTRTKARVFHLPLWTRTECIAADTALKLNLGAEVVAQRYLEIGGVARLVLETDPEVYHNHFDYLLSNVSYVLQELNVLTGAPTSPRGDHNWLYYDVSVNPDGKYDYKHAVLNFGTKFLVLLVGKVLEDRFTLIADMDRLNYARDTPDILGHIFEGCATHCMAERGLEGLKYVTLGTPATATQPFLVKFETFDRFNRAYTKQYVDVEKMPSALAAAPAGTMLIPTTLSYSTFSFILVSDAEPEGARLFAFVQVTTAQKWEVSVEAVAQFIILVATIGAHSDQVAGLFYFVPPAAYKTLTAKKVPVIAGYSGHVFKCTLNK